MTTASVIDAHGKQWDADGSRWIRSAAWSNQRAVIKLADNIYQAEIQKPVTLGVWLPMARPERFPSFEAAAMFAYSLMGG